MTNQATYIREDEMTDKSKDDVLDDLFYGKTPETRLLNDICAVATKDSGRFTSFTMENVGEGWKRIEFYWKPKKLKESR